MELFSIVTAKKIVLNETDPATHASRIWALIKTMQA